MLIHPALWSKSLHESRWLWLACAATLFLFCWLHVAITSQVDMARFESLLNHIPRHWEKFSPVPFRQLLSYPARIAVTYEEPLVYLLMTVWCLSRSSDIVSGELGRGTMELLLAQPVSRRQVLWTPVCLTLLGALLLAAAAWCGTAAGIVSTTIERPAPHPSWTIPFTTIPVPLGAAAADPQRIPMRALAPVHLFLPAVANYFCLGVFLTGLGTLLSAVDHHRWRVLGLAGGFYVLQLLGEIVGQAFSQLAWLGYLSFFRAYEPVRFVSESLERPDDAWGWWLRDDSGRIIDLGPLSGCAVLAGLGLLALLAGSLVFSRRDLPAPL